MLTPLFIDRLTNVLINAWYRSIVVSSGIERSLWISKVLERK